MVPIGVPEFSFKGRPSAGNNNMKLAVIPARGGSKRIVGKNIREFCGKPMIAWSIEAAIKSGCFDRVVVSTDNELIASVALEYGAEVPFRRPESLSDDHTGTIPVIHHAVDWFISHGYSVEYVCCIYATAPFISPEDLRSGEKLIKSSDWSYAFSATSYAFPIQRALRVAPDGQVSMFNAEMFAARSQDLEEAWHDAGQFYWGTTAAWVDERVIFGKWSVAVPIPRYRVQDVDTPEDWDTAEYLFEALRTRQEHG